MNQLTKIFFFFFITVVMTSCTDKKEIRNPDFLVPLKIEIPSELADNTDAVEFIKSSEDAINEFSDNIEELALEGEDLLSKNVEDLDAMDKIKLGKMAIQFVYNSTQMMEVTESMQNYMKDAQSNSLTESQIKAFNSIVKAVENRVKEINTKYTKLNR